MQLQLQLPASWMDAASCWTEAVPGGQRTQTLCNEVKARKHASNVELKITQSKQTKKCRQPGGAEHGTEEMTRHPWQPLVGRPPSVSAAAAGPKHCCGCKCVQSACYTFILSPDQFAQCRALTFSKLFSLARLPSSNPRFITFFLIRSSQAPASQGAGAGRQAGTQADGQAPSLPLAPASEAAQQQSRGWARSSLEVCRRIVQAEAHRVER